MKKCFFFISGIVLLFSVYVSPFVTQGVASYWLLDGARRMEHSTASCEK